MGQLTLPSTGPVYLDANGFIYSVERIVPYDALLTPMWLAAQQGQFEIVTSELSLLEALVKPLRMGDTVIEGVFRSVFHAREVRLLPVTAAIWEQAAVLRASHPALRTPDALHAACALTAQCTQFLTNDPGFRHIVDLPVTLLRDVLAA